MDEKEKNIKTLTKKRQFPDIGVSFAYILLRPITVQEKTYLK
jgi:hypothetical protein